MPSLSSLAYQTIGLTGNPGAGKSVAAQWFRDRGAHVVVGDELGYEMLKSDSPVFSDLIQTFGHGILSGDGEIDRKALGKIVFNDPHQLEILNAIVHPPMLCRIKEEIQSFRKQQHPGPWILDAALIFEWKIEDWFDKVILVKANREIRRRRFEQLRGGTHHFEERESLQIPQAEKEKRALIVIPNNDSIKKLYEIIQNLFDG